MFSHGEALIYDFRLLIFLNQWLPEAVELLAASCRVAFRRNSVASSAAVSTAHKFGAARFRLANAELLQGRGRFDWVSAFLAPLHRFLKRRLLRPTFPLGFSAAVAAAFGVFANGTLFATFARLSRAN